MHRFIWPHKVRTCGKVQYLVVGRKKKRKHISRNFFLEIRIIRVMRSVKRVSIKPQIKSEIWHEATDRWVLMWNRAFWTSRLISPHSKQRSRDVNTETADDMERALLWQSVFLRWSARGAKMDLENMDQSGPFELEPLFQWCTTGNIPRGWEMRKFAQARRSASRQPSAFLGARRRRGEEDSSCFPGTNWNKSRAKGGRGRAIATGIQLSAYGCSIHQHSQAVNKPSALCFAKIQQAQKKLPRRPHPYLIQACWDKRWKWPCCKRLFTDRERRGSGRCTFKSVEQERAAGNRKAIDCAVWKKPRKARMFPSTSEKTKEKLDGSRRHHCWEEQFGSLGRGTLS